MPSPRPKYITFDCYGTLTNFQMTPHTRVLLADRVRPEDMPRFCANFAAYRLDEVLGAWKPYAEVIAASLERACKLWRIPFRASDAQEMYDAIPSWGPHPDVPVGLAPVARRFPLVILSNASDSQILYNVDKLGAPFHAVYTAEQARAYKPRMQAFEYMLDRLGCAPEDVLHCSSSFRYDLMTAYDMGITAKAFVNRGHEPPNPYYAYHEINDIGGLAALVGL
jgi:2-haloacid dehalogenase